VFSLRALSSVNLLQNEISVKQAYALASMLKAHPTLKSLCGGNETESDMSGKMNTAGDAIMLVAEIVSNRAMTTITFGDLHIVTMKTDMTEADFSGKQLHDSGAIILAAFLPKCR
jgi:hypothetical protein